MKENTQIASIENQEDNRRHLIEKAPVPCFPQEVILHINNIFTHTEDDFYFLKEKWKQN